MKAIAASLALATLFVLGSLTAHAAGPFDGEWTGRSVTEFGRCPHVFEVRLSIRDGAVSGEMVRRHVRITVATTVDDRGRMAHVFGYNGDTVLKTTGGRLGAREGRIDWWGNAVSGFLPGGGDICHGVITLERAAPRQAAELPRS